MTTPMTTPTATPPTTRTRLPRNVDLLADLARSRQQFDRVLDAPCTTHAARGGQPCWSLKESQPAPGGPRVRRDLPAVCAARVALVFAPPRDPSRPHRPTKKSGRTAA